MIGGEVGSGRVCCHSHINLVQRSGGDVVILFCMPSQTKGVAYCVGDSSGGRGEKVSWSKIVRKCNEERIND